MHPNIIRAGALALSLSLIAILSWEFHLRHTGHDLTYDDNEALWADKRAMVYNPADNATVFIGSSRIKYDLDIPTWRALTEKTPFNCQMWEAVPGQFSQIWPMIRISGGIW
ncbi:MAG: hypothetical protein WDM78_20450 [Puia sp.]